MKNKLCWQVSLLLHFLSAQDIIMNTVGKGDLPDSVDLAAITVEWPKCTISNVTLPDNAAKVILTVEYTDSTLPMKKLSR